MPRPNLEDEPSLYAKARELAQNPQIPHVDIDELKNADDLLIVISQRRANGTVTFAVFKQFERDGKTQRTAFVPENLHGSLLELMKLLPARVSQLRKEGRLVFTEHWQQAGR